MKEVATVVKTAGKIAVLVIEKTPACEGCKICAFRNGKSRVKVKALNAAGARAGDRVIVRAEKDRRALASFIAYILPVLFGGAGVAVGFVCFAEQLCIALLCLAGLALGFLAVWAIDRRLAKKSGFGMEVVEIIESQGENKEESTDG